MLPTLTDRQKAICDFLLKTIREKGFAPSIHEIGRQFKIASTNGAKDVKFAKDYALRDQFRRTVVDHVKYCSRVRTWRQSGIHSVSVCRQSIMRRSSLAPLRRFGSIYIAQKDCDDVSKSFRRLSIMISNLIDYLKRSGMKGSKYTPSNQSKNSRSATQSETI